MQPGLHAMGPSSSAPPSWALVVGVLCRERDKVSRRRLRELYRLVPSVLVRFVVVARYAAKHTADEPDLFGVAVRSDDSGQVAAYKELQWWRHCHAWRGRYYVKTDQDAVLNLPLLLRLTTATDAAATSVPGREGSADGPLVFAGDINWGTWNLTSLQGHCWADEPRAAVRNHKCKQRGQRCCPREYGPAPFATGALQIFSAALQTRLSRTIARRGWAARTDLIGYYADRLIGLGVTEDSRRVLMVYLNPYNHYDQPTGVYEQEVRATSGQRSTLYALEGPGGLLVSHHVRTPRAFDAAVEAMLPAVQSADQLRVSCRPLRRIVRLDDLPPSLARWRSCTLSYRYTVNDSMTGYCRATAGGGGDCARGNDGAWEVGGRRGVRDLDDCVSRCRACARCSYVSFSSYHGDCSVRRAAAYPLADPSGSWGPRAASPLGPLVPQPPAPLTVRPPRVPRSGSTRAMSPT